MTIRATQCKTRFYRDGKNLTIFAHFIHEAEGTKTLHPEPHQRRTVIVSTWKAFREACELAERGKLPSDREIMRRTEEPAMSRFETPAEYIARGGTIDIVAPIGKKPSGKSLTAEDWMDILDGVTESLSEEITPIPLQTKEKKHATN